MLTRKHFVQVAATVKALAMAGDPNADKIREDYVATFAKDNPRFDATRFRNACAPDVAAPKKRARKAA